jgi:hypothetical protein
MSMMGDPQGSTDSGNEEGQVDPDSLASPFLNNIPLEDREIVGKYVKDWDAGVTKKFQEIHGQYTPYKELGDPETLASAMQIQDLLNNQPEYLLNEIAKVLGYEVNQPGQQQQLPGQQVPGQQQPGIPNPAQQQQGNVSPEFQQFQAQIAQQQQALEQMAQILIAKNEQEQQQQQDQALDALMSDLRTKHGDFDEQFVLMQLAQGKSADDAIKAFAETVGKYGGHFGGAKLPPGPPALSGGIVPSGAKGVAEMDSKETQNLVASIMKAATQG